jgi:hypothetical protein
MPEWNELRARLNHDLVKNRLIPGTTRMIRIVSGSVLADPLETFDSTIATVWTETSPSLQLLFDTCESALSPRKYFLVEPLVHCPPSTMEWLPDIIHELWLERHDIPGWCSTGKLLVEELDTAVPNARNLLELNNGISQTVDLVEIFLDLQKRTTNLSIHLSLIERKSLL